MKITNYFFSSLMVVLLFISCGSDDSGEVGSSGNNENTINENSTNNSTGKKILILGASRVEGNPPDYDSFRYDLWKTLVENNLSFDFIGVEKDLNSYPSINNLNFDPDHEGRAGWTSGQINNEISNSLAELDRPDIVLFSSPGGNDALQGLSYSNALANINAIIDKLQEDNPNVTIIIEQMAPARQDAMTAELTSTLNQLREDVTQIASNQTTETSNVSTIDIQTGFTQDMYADEVHYNGAGAVFVAAKYYEKLLPLLSE